MCLDAENTVSLRESRAGEPGPEEPGPEGVTSAGFPELMASLRLCLRASAGFLTATSSVNLQAVPMAMVAAMEMPLNAPSLAAAAAAAMSKAAGPGPKAVPRVAATLAAGACFAANCLEGPSGTETPTMTLLLVALLLGLRLAR